MPLSSSWRPSVLVFSSKKALETYLGGSHTCCCSLLLALTNPPCTCASDSPHHMGYIWLPPHTPAPPCLPYLPALSPQQGVSQIPHLWSTQLPQQLNVTRSQLPCPHLSLLGNIL